MKSRLILMAAVVAAFASACTGNSTSTEPEWYADEAYFIGRNSLFNELPVSSGDIVMVGDDYIDLGEWRAFFAKDNIKNRGIRGDATAHILYRIDSVAAHKPAKIFLSAGLNDIIHGAKAEVPAAGVKAIVSRIKKLSPETEIYYLNTVSPVDLSAEQQEEVKKLNETVLKDAASKKFTCIDLASALNEGIKDGSYSYNGGVYLNGAGYEAYARLIQEYVGSDALNKAADDKYADKDEELSEYLKGWYGIHSPEGCMLPVYYKSRLSVFRSLPETHNGVLLLGDSLTDFAEWNDLLPKFHVYARGIAGDMIEGIALRSDEIVADQPNKIFIMAGSNNFTKHPEKDVLAYWNSYEALIKKVKKECPKATVYVQSVLPANPILGADYNDYNKKAGDLNKILQAGAQPDGYIYIDLTAPLTDENGDLRLECTTDGCHLNATGYLTWATQLLEIGRILVVGDPYTENK